MAAYCNQEDMEKVFGARSIHSWADVDGDDDGYTIAARVAWSQNLATEIINSRLQRARYTIPFTTVPTLIVSLTAMKAGILLHDARAITNNVNTDEVAMIRKQYHSMLNQILKGILKLLNPTTQAELDIKIDYQSPFAVKFTDDDDSDDVTLVYEG